MIIEKRRKEKQNHMHIHKYGKFFVADISSWNVSNYQTGKGIKTRKQMGKKKTQQNGIKQNRTNSKDIPNWMQTFELLKLNNINQSSTAAIDSVISIQKEGKNSFSILHDKQIDLWWQF